MFTKEILVSFACPGFDGGPKTLLPEMDRFNYKSVEYMDIGISSCSVPSSGSVVQHIVLVLILLWQPSFLALMTKRVPIYHIPRNFVYVKFYLLVLYLAFSTFWPTNFDDTLFPHRTLSSFLIFFLLNLKYKPSFYAHLDDYS